VIPPGGEGKIEVTFSTGNFRGLKKKKIQVWTNDPDEAEVQLMVSAFIEVEFDVSPRSLHVGRLHREKSFTKRVKIEGKDLETLQITSIETSSDKVEAKLVEEREDGKRQLYLDVTVKPGLPVGRVRESVTLKSNRENAKEVMLHIYGEIIGDISVTPQRAHFGYFPPGTTPERTINLDMIPEGKTFRITKVEDTTGWVDAKVETVEEGRHYKINLKIKDGFDQQRLTGNLLISTDYPEQARIEVPLYGGLRRQGAARMGGATHNRPPGAPPPPKRDLSKQAASGARFEALPQSDPAAPQDLVSGSGGQESKEHPGTK